MVTVRLKAVLRNGKFQAADRVSGEPMIRVEIVPSEIVPNEAKGRWESRGTSMRGQSSNDEHAGVGNTVDGAIYYEAALEHATGSGNTRCCMRSLLETQEALDAML